MKHQHQIADDIDLNVNIDVVLPTEELGDLVEKVTESVIIIIAVATAAHILRGWFK